MSEICACPGTLPYCPKHSLRQDKEEKMKCLNCGLEMFERNGQWICPDVNCPRLNIPVDKKPNPSPQEILDVIRKDNCEKAIMEFSYWMNNYKPRFFEPIPDKLLDEIKQFAPEDYKWLVSKGLVKQKMVRREGYIRIFKKSDYEIFSPHIILEYPGEIEGYITAKVAWEEPEGRK